MEYFIEYFMEYFMEYHVHQVMMEEEAKGWQVGCSFSSTSTASPKPKYSRPKQGSPKSYQGRGGTFLSPVFLLLLLLPAGLLAQHHLLLPEQGDKNLPLCQTLLAWIQGEAVIKPPSQLFALNPF